VTNCESLIRSRAKRCRQCGKFFQNTAAGSCDKCGADLAFWSELSLEDHENLDEGRSTLEVI
jgi:rRNA maturation endonuclease Nob1